MIKLQIRWLILGFIFLILFNVLFFLLGGNRPIASIWISYGFIHFAYLQILVIPSIVPKSKSTHVFIESTAVISTFYFLIELFVGILFILLKLKSWILALVLQLLFFSAFIIVFLLIHFTNKRTASVEEQRKITQKTINKSFAVLERAMVNLSGKDKDYIYTLISDLKTLPLSTSSALQGIENNIIDECEEIQQAANNGNTDALRMHGAVLSQLIMLRKQTHID